MTRYSKGLQGVIAGESKVGLVDGLKGLLCYRGFSIEDLATQGSYTETAFLLLEGRLPNQKELESFRHNLKEKHSLPDPILQMCKLFPKDAHPMESLQTIVAALGAYYHDTVDSISADELKKRSVELIAQFPTIVAACWRASIGKEPISPNKELGHGANFLYMLTGKKPDEEAATIFDTCLTLHAEHSFNASTFTARVVSSSESSLHSAVSAAVGSLYGPLHGGANERVLQMISDIKGPEEAEAFVMDKLAKKEKIMGMGHRIYQVKDPRSFILEEMLDKYSQKKGEQNEYKILKALEKTMQREMEKKGKDIWPNVDFFSGALYKLLGIPVELFTPIFAIARIAGWCAHINEQQEDNRLYRPICEYIGANDQTFVPIQQR